MTENIIVNTDNVELIKQKTADDKKYLYHHNIDVIDEQQETFCSTNTSLQQMIKKQFIDSHELLNVSHKLAIQIYNSGFRPDYIVGVWRGGTPVGIAVQELLEYLGVKSDHIAIRTSSYTGIAERARHIEVYGLHYIVENTNSEDSLLIVDDVYDTGLSIQQVITDITQACGGNAPEIKIATPYFKPKNNETDRIPDYFIYETHEWLVFPHELDGLSEEEIKTHKPNLSKLLEQIKRD